LCADGCIVSSVTPDDQITTLLKNMAEENDADVILCNCEMVRGVERRFVNACRKRKRRPNVILILVTSGGNADVSFRIARYLQCAYVEFTCVISGWCKSAGTLLMLGAHKVVFGIHGELGPLDVQMAKKDELLESESGLTVMAALTAIHEKTLLAFEHFFLETTFKAAGRLSVQTASEIAVGLAKGLFAPIAKQIDPIHIGEAWRSMAIATEYGQRLIEKSKNVDPDSLTKIISGYPSHSFVIDRTEAETIFENVRQATDDEQEFLDSLGQLALYPAPKTIIRYLNEAPKEEPHADIDTGKENDLPAAEPRTDASPSGSEEDATGDGNGQRGQVVKSSSAF
jgi:hypothetical protein